MTRRCVGLEMWLVLCASVLSPWFLNIMSCITAWDIVFACLLYAAVCHFSLNSARFKTHSIADEDFSRQGCGTVQIGI
jgi:hypothetical protein